MRKKVYPGCFNRIKAAEFDINEGIEQLKNLRVSMILDYIKGYLIALTIYLALTLIQMALTNSYINKYVVIFGCIFVVVVTFIFGKRPRMMISIS